MKILITNNPMVNKNHFDDVEKIFLENAELLSVLFFVRDKIHQGHKLLTHPLSGSIKPNQTPYKSIMITKEQGTLDFDSLKLIEDSITVAKGLANTITAKSFLEDFQLIDFNLIRSGLT